jgi:hypothetical protein
MRRKRRLTSPLSTMPNSEVSLDEMNAHRLKHWNLSLEDCKRLVNQLEQYLLHSKPTSAPVDSNSLLLLPPLTASDIPSLIVPLVKRLLQEQLRREEEKKKRGGRANSKQHGRVARAASRDADSLQVLATLVERILSHVVAQLPSKLEDRFQLVPHLEDHDSRFRHANDSDTRPIVATLEPLGTLAYPTATMYNAALMAWGSVRSLQAAQRTENIMQRMMDEYQAESQFLQQVVASSPDRIATRTGHPPPDNLCFKSLLRAWSVAASDRLVEEADPMPARRARETKNSAPRRVPSSTSAATKAYEVLLQMEQLSGVCDLLAIVSRYGGSESAREWRRFENSLKGNIQCMQEIQNWREQWMSEKVFAMPIPERDLYNKVMTAHAKEYVDDAHVIDRMRELCNRVHLLAFATNRHDLYFLDGVAYQSILRVYERYFLTVRPCDGSLLFGPSQDDESSLQKLHSDHERNCQFISEIEDCFRQIYKHDSTIDSALSTSTSHGFYESSRSTTGKRTDSFSHRSHQDFLDEGIDESHARLERVCDTMSIHWAYEVLISALLRTHQASSERFEISKHLLKADGYAMMLLGQQPPPDDFPFPQSATIRSNQAYDTNLSPARLMHLVRTYENCRSNEHSRKASSKRIDELIQIYASGVSYKRVYFLNEAMEYLQKSNWAYAPELVEAMLVQAVNKDLYNRAKEPTRIYATSQTFAVAIKAWLSSKVAHAAFRAEVILHNLVSVFENTQYDGGHKSLRDRYKPTDAHLHYVMMAWAKRAGSHALQTDQPVPLMPSRGLRFCGMAGENKYAAEHCEGVLRRYEFQPWVGNVSGHYATAMRAWAHQQFDSDDSGRPDATGHLIVLRDDLQRRTKNISAYNCNWVLEACARPQKSYAERLRSYEVAVDTFHRALRNERSYVLLLKAIRTQVFSFDIDNLSVAEAVFHDCCKNGLLTQDLVWEISCIVSPETLQRMFGIPYTLAVAIKEAGVCATPDGIPANWSRGSPPKSLLVGNLPPEWSAKVQKINRRPQFERALRSKSQNEIAKLA